MKQRIPNFDDFLFERGAQDIIKKSKKWVEILPDDYEDLKDDFFSLVQTAYKEIGGHVKVKKPDDVFRPEWSYWVAKDVDNDGDIDIARGAKVTQFGKKSAIVGHDGSKDAKRAYLKSMGDDLKKRGFYAEVSEKLAEILIQKYKVHTVTNPKAIEAILGKEVEYHGEHPDGNKPGNGWYSRKIAGGMHTKILVGRPMIKESAETSKPTILSLHGYESSVMPERLAKLKDDYNIIAPSMDYDNVQNLFKKTYNKVKNEKIDLIVGSSMGGYFGYYLATLLNVPALLFNPAVIETASGIEKQEVSSGKNKPKMIIVSGNKDNIVIQNKLEDWFKENARNYSFEKVNMGHRIEDDIYDKYIKLAFKKIV